MTSHKQSILRIATIVALFAVFASITFLFAMTTPPADAKGIFGLGKKTANATTTNAFMAPGTATTTLTYDTYTDGLSTADSMALLVRLTGSSTFTKLNIAQEFSQDGIDWYRSSQPNIIQNATTTTAVDISQVPVFSWRFASSSIGGATAAGATDTRLIVVKSPTRFTRFILSMGTSTDGSANGSVWAQILPVKQNP